MPEKTGLNEIAFTQWKSESFNFVANDQNTGKVRKKRKNLNRQNMIRIPMFSWHNRLNFGTPQHGDGVILIAHFV